jgi:hypothetical protein
MPLSTARASAPTAVVSVLPEIRLNPPLNFRKLPVRDRLLEPTDTPADIFYQPLNPTLPRTNRESRMQNP